MKGDKADEVKKIYETVGTYLGYALAGYCEFYKIDHVMILGRVSKGKGGDIMLDQAKKVGTATAWNSTDQNGPIFSTPCFAFSRCCSPFPR